MQRREPSETVAASDRHISTGGIETEHPGNYPALAPAAYHAQGAWKNEAEEYDLPLV